MVKYVRPAETRSRGSLTNYELPYTKKQRAARSIFRFVPTKQHRRSSSYCCQFKVNNAVFNMVLEMANQTLPYNKIVVPTADGSMDNTCDVEASSGCSESSCETIYLLVLPDSSAPPIEKKRNRDDENFSMCTLSTKGSFGLESNLPFVHVPPPDLKEEDPYHDFYFESSASTEGSLQYSTCSEKEWRDAVL